MHRVLPESAAVSHVLLGSGFPVCSCLPSLVLTVTACGGRVVCALSVQLVDELPVFFPICTHLSSVSFKKTIFGCLSKILDKVFLSLCFSSLCYFSFKNKQIRQKTIN